MSVSDRVDEAPAPKGRGKSKRRSSSQVKVAIAMIDTYMAQLDSQLALLKQAIKELKALVS